MAEVLLSKNAITVYEVLVILVLVVILVRQKKQITFSALLRMHLLQGKHSKRRLALSLNT